jgi:hypothetical protein
MSWITVAAALTVAREVSQGPRKHCRTLGKQLMGGAARRSSGRTAATNSTRVSLERLLPSVLLDRSVAFEKYARGVRSAEISELARRCSTDPFVLDLMPGDVTWDYPHRLLAAVRWLILASEAEPYGTAEDPWAAFRSILAEHQNWVSDFIREHGIQTNEVQRCFVLLPIFLTVARMSGKPLDLIELGASGGLNLLWDRYRYRYAEGMWGPPNSEFELVGDELSTVPGDLLQATVVVRRRRGVDLDPLDISSEAGLRLLESFLLDDQPRVQRLHRAAEVARRDPPELLRGDYVDLLPELVRERDESALTVVFQTLSTIYLPDERLAQLLAHINQAGNEGPLAWISTPTPPEHGQRRGDYPVELTIWPGGERRVVARMNVTGDQLNWLR